VLLLGSRVKLAAPSLPCIASHGTEGREVHGAEHARQRSGRPQGVQRARGWEIDPPFVIKIYAKIENFVLEKDS
jgi:hypothetical protein